ncbi:MAG: twin-arginine translocase subunit TatC [Flavobacterium sp.]|jgi:sec-independent protein translocase protein TatC
MNKKEEFKEMSFLDHLEDLRWFLIRSVLAILVGAFIAFFFYDFIFDIILFGPKDPNFITYKIFCNLSQEILKDTTLCINEINMKILNREMGGQFSAHLWMSITVGIIFSFPFILWEFWKFISPALYKNEKKHAFLFIFVSTLLFIIGVLFGYYIVAPLSVQFLANYELSKEIENGIDLSSYISLIKTSTIASGILFELPIIIYFLTKLGLVTPQFLSKNRRYTIVIVLVVAAVITPPDILSQIIVSIPILILYELSILISKIVYHQMEKRLVVSS